MHIHCVKLKLKKNVVIECYLGFFFHNGPISTYLSGDRVVLITPDHLNCISILHLKHLHFNVLCPNSKMS